MILKRNSLVYKLAFENPMSYKRTPDKVSVCKLFWLVISALLVVWPVTIAIFPFFLAFAIYAIFVFGGNRFDFKNWKISGSTMLPPIVPVKWLQTKIGRIIPIYLLLLLVGFIWIPYSLYAVCKYGLFPEFARTAISSDFADFIVAAAQTTGFALICAFSTLIGLFCSLYALAFVAKQIPKKETICPLIEIQ